MTARLSPADLAAIGKRVDRAAKEYALPLRFVNREEGRIQDANDKCVVSAGSFGSYGMSSPGMIDSDDAEILVSAVNDIPRLLAHAAALEVEIAARDALLREFRDQIEEYEAGNIWDGFGCGSCGADKPHPHYQGCKKMLLLTRITAALDRKEGE